MPSQGTARPIDDGPFWRKLLPATLVAILVSYLLRAFWQPLHGLCGSYPSDIWYMHINYSWFLVHRGFFEMEYPAGLFAFVKALSVVCQHLFPMTEPHRHGGLLYRYEDWLLVNSVALGLAGVGISWCMHRLDAEFFHLRRGRLLWAFVWTPSFVFFNLFNYDALPVLCCTASLLALLRRDVVGSFLLLGIGTGVKIYPAVLMPLYLLGVPREHRLEAICWFLGALAALNLPFLWLNPQAWWFPYHWQMGFDQTEQTGRFLYTLSNWLGKGPALLTMASLALGMVAFVWRRAPAVPLDSPRWLARASLLLVGLFIFTKNVFSPQYFFWLLPFATLGTGYPFAGVASLLELANIAEAFGLDYWRSGHEEGLAWIRLVRDLGLAALVAHTVLLLGRSQDD